MELMQLLPCPFCGDIPNIMRYETSIFGAKEKDFTIECLCGVSIGKYQSESKAYWAWNRRVDRNTET